MIHFKFLFLLWNRKSSSGPNSFRQQGKENPPHPRWSSHMLFSERITLWHCLPVFCGGGIVLFLYMHLCSLCQRSQTGVPYILFTLCSIIFSKRKEYWVCETDLYKKDLHNNLDFQLLNQKCQKAGSNGHPLVKVTLKDWMLAPPCSGSTQGPCSPVCYYPHWHVSLIYVTNLVPIWLAAYFCSSWQVHRHRVWELAKSLRAGIFKHYYI